MDYYTQYINDKIKGWQPGELFHKLCEGYRPESKAFLYTPYLADNDKELTDFENTYKHPKQNLKKWEKHEIRYLQLNRKKSVSKMAKELGRTRYSVRSKLYKLGIRRSKK